MAGFLGVFLLYSIISIGFNSSESDAQFQAQQAADLAAWQETPAGKLCAEHPTWKRPACDAIVEKKVIVGMTKEQAIAAWGRPKDINTTATANGTHEQWVYGLSTYLYFDNGVLTAAQN